MRKVRISRVMEQIVEQRIAIELRQSRVSRFVGKFQPLKRFVRLTAIRVHFSDLMGPQERDIFAIRPAKAVFDSCSRPSA